MERHLFSAVQKQQIIAGDILLRSLIDLVWLLSLQSRNYCVIKS